jgi:hypothetical protein
LLAALASLPLAAAAGVGAVAPLLDQSDSPAVGVTASADVARQGDVVMLSLKCECPADSGTAVSTLFDRTVQLSRQADNSWRLLAGIDLDIKPGTYAIALKLNRREAPPLEASYRLRVASREFPVRRLTVAPEFVNPPAEVQGRIAEEAVRLQTVFKGTTTPRPIGLFEAPVPTAVSSNFGARSEFNGQRRSPHAGVDFRGAVGSPVLAPGDGTVALAADLYFTGQTVVLDHGWGLHSILAHLSSIAVEPGIARATVSRILARAGLSRLSALDPAPLPRRYERARPGALLHIDSKKLARIVQVGHRVTGDPRDSVEGAGWEAAFVAIDDRSRVAVAEMFADERKRSAADFLEHAVRYYRRLGVAVRCIMTNNANVFRSRPSIAACRCRHLRHIFSNPIPLVPMARPSASSRPLCANGPTGAPTAIRASAPPTCQSGCIATIDIDRTPPCPSPTHQQARSRG